MYGSSIKAIFNVKERETEGESLYKKELNSSKKRVFFCVGARERGISIAAFVFAIKSL